MEEAIANCTEFQAQLGADGGRAHHQDGPLAMSVGAYDRTDDGDLAGTGPALEATPTRCARTGAQATPNCGGRCAGPTQALNLKSKRDPLISAESSGAGFQRNRLPLGRG
jgi:hypothetical protein